MPPFLSVYGHITVDQIMSVDEFPVNNTSVNITEKNTLLGGTGTNISVTASSLGVPTALCGFVGDDFPVAFREFIISKNVITDEFITRNDYDTAQAMIFNDNKKEQRALFYQGPQGSASLLNNVLTKNANVSEFVHFSTGDPDYYLNIMSAIKDKRIKISFDPAQEIDRIWDKKRFMEALSLSDILFCNRYEAQTVLKYSSVDSLSKVDARMVICTKGSDGSEFYSDGQLTNIPAFATGRVADATGAGDAYRSGFYAGKYRKYSNTDSLVIGAATASFVVEKVGALSNIPSWDMVMERADRYLGKL